METTIATPTRRPATRHQRVVVEYGGPGDWWVMYENGEIGNFFTPAQCMREIARRARRVVRSLEKQGLGAAVVTTIEWRDTPKGFTPPTA